MKISFSVIIVAYKSRSFIACCLSSLLKAAKGFKVEVIVIDNASSDGIKKFIQNEFVDVRFVQNEENIGFGAACNQGARLAVGDNLVFLNPDTIVSENFFDSLSQAIQELPEAGILSAMLYDGHGRFLPESARRIPSIKSAINKSLGRRESRSQYYETINSERYQEIEVVPGAAMLIERSKFEDLGGFDERFFMYAEDVDLSYRIAQKKYKNYLIKGAAIIHLKGESTSKAGWNYNRYFYSTMASFVKKYRGDIYSNLEWIIVSFFTLFLGVISFCYHSVRSAKTGILDFVLGVMLFLSVQFTWSYARYGVWDYFGYLDHLGSIVLYVGIWIGMMLLGGAYWRDRTRRNTLKALILGLLLSLVAYSLVPLEWRFSRAVILFSGMLMLIMKFFKTGITSSNNEGRMIYVNNEEIENIPLDITSSLGVEKRIENVKSANLDKLGLSSNDHILVNTDDTYDPVKLVLDLGSDFKYSYISSKTRQIISSHLSSIPGNKYDHLSHHNLSKRTFTFQKRIVDIIVAVIVIIPLLLYQVIFIQKIDLKNWKRIISGEKTIVGYGEGHESEEIVRLTDYLIPCFSESDSAELRLHKIMNYSLHYSIFDDGYYIFLNWRSLLSTYTHGKIKRKN